MNRCYPQHNVNASLFNLHLADLNLNSFEAKLIAMAIKYF